MTSPQDAPDLAAYLLSERTHLRMPSKPHWIEAAVEWLRQKAVLSGACHESRAGKLLVALHEALSNAIVHGNLEISSSLKESGDDAFARLLAKRVADPRYAGRSVDVHIDCDANQCRWTITDEGPGFDVETVLRRHESDDPELLLASGRGILIMKSFLDVVRWEQGGRRLILALERTSGEEKRRETRVSHQQPVRVAPIRPDGSVDWQAAYDAVGRNYSGQGMAVIQEQLAQADRILIAMTVNEEVIYVPAEVRHCRSVASGIVELGCRFQAEPAPKVATTPSTGESLARMHEAITTLLEQHAEPRLPGDERRRHPRAVYTERVDIFAGPRADAMPGYARDLSKGGISFIIHAPLQDEIVVALLPRDGSQPLHLRARVVRCNRLIEGFYDVGAQFLELEN